MKATDVRTTPFDPAQYLKSDRAIAAFLANALEANNPEYFQRALQVAARAYGMSKIADASGLSRESLYKAVRPDAKPRFETVQKILGALGAQISIHPLPSSAPTHAASA